jgi:quinol-cytochrome oxidoreductase complex cytochrome b subunit
MEYYIISFFVSLVIFIFVYEKNDNNEQDPDNKKSIFSLNNFMLFTIIYIVMTIFGFYTKTINLAAFLPAFMIDILKTPVVVDKEVIENNKDELDPKTISKITDNIDIGFMPPVEENVVNEEKTN